MTTAQLLAAAWDWEPSVIAGCAALAVLYGTWVRLRHPGKSLYFYSGILVMFFALVGPLDVLGDTYLFSAHMLQHLLLILIVPPLLILGLPEEDVRRLLQPSWIARTERLLRRPLLAWFLGIGTLWVWHAPALYNATLRSESIHIFEHLTFLTAGTVYWWPVFCPLRESRMPSLTGVLYLFFGGAANSILGIILTFTPIGLYPAYLDPVDSMGALMLLRRGWGLTPQVDQQLGGLLMWVPGMLVFLFAALHVFGRWYREADPGPFEGIGRPRPRPAPASVQGIRSRLSHADPGNQRRSRLVCFFQEGSHP